MTAMVSTNSMEATMTEADFQRKITDLCDWLGLKWHHETDSRKSKKGFPDLVIAGEGGVIFAELKSKRGKLTDSQGEWLGTLLAAGATAYVWYPQDWPSIYERLHRLAGRRATVLSLNSRR